MITLKLNDMLERKLRERASRLYGLARGSLSRAVEDALTLWLQSTPPDRTESAGERYVALMGRRPIATAASLEQLAGKLRKLGVDPRDVELRSTEPVPRVERLGLRVS